MPDRHRSTTQPVRAVSFDLFGTLVKVTRPDDPAAAVATALRDWGVAVPADWQTRYRTPQVATEPGVEVSLYDHVYEALQPAADAEHRPTPDRSTVEAAVDDAFDPTVETRANASRVVREIGDRLPVLVLSNSAIPGLVDLAIERSILDRKDFDAVVSSVDCGWRKPDAKAFETVANAVDVSVDHLLHVGDDPATDGGIADVGGTFVAIGDVELGQVPTIVVGQP
jgi:FMN phosphatase YigB (HAD superfamily)